MFADCHVVIVAAIFSILMEMRVFQFYFYFSARWELAQKSFHYLLAEHCLV
jgi:hypothetical protein